MREIFSIHTRERAEEREVLSGEGGEKGAFVVRELTRDREGDGTEERGTWKEKKRKFTPFLAHTHLGDRVRER